MCLCEGASLRFATFCDVKRDDRRGKGINLPFVGVWCGVVWFVKRSKQR